MPIRGVETMAKHSKGGQGKVKVSEFCAHRKIEEAKTDLMLTLLPIDGRFAKQCDPTHCVIARGSNRQEGKHGVTDTFIWKGVAYLGYKNKVVRYILNPEARYVVKSFDKYGIAHHPTITLIAPPPSQTLAGQRAKAQERKTQIKKRKDARKAGAPAIRTRTFDEEYSHFRW
jgi:hypothetical protein